MHIVLEPFSTKSELYSALEAPLRDLLGEAPDVIAALANASALLYDALPDLNWLGFYRMIDGALVVGPFQGKPAVSRISLGAGVCGTCAATLAQQRVDDVHTCKNHIACDMASSSEIVTPIVVNGILWAVLDVDSPLPRRFDADDEAGMARLAKIIEEYLR